MNFKHIHIGELIEKRVCETQTDILRITNFLDCTEEEIRTMYKSKDLNADILLRWSKLLDYDFFRIYTQHLILYAPQSNSRLVGDRKEKSALPIFRKNIYTKEVIQFILKLISTGEKTKNQIITEYQIPKTTLYKWISKYKA